MENKLYANRQLINLTIPLIISTSLSLLVGMIDSVMVAAVGEAAVSGVSLVDFVIQLMIYIFSAMAAGGAIVAGQYLGSKDMDSAHKATNELVWLNAGISLLITVLMLLLSETILNTFFGNITDEVRGHASRYMTVVILSLPAIALFESGSAIFRTMNDSNTAMKISLVMNSINCVGNAILIYGCSMGTLGAAIATFAARWAAAATVLFLLTRDTLELSIERSLKHRFSPAMVKNILSIGLPNGIENGMFQFGKIALPGLVTTFGTAAIAANSVTQVLASIQMIPGCAISLAMTTVISRCVGSGDYNQTRYYNRKLLAISYICEAIVTGILLLALPYIIALYNLSDEANALTVSMFHWHALGGALLWPMAFNLPAALRAAGDVRFPMVISICSMWVFRYGGAYVLAYHFDLGAVGAWISMTMLDWGFRTIIYLLRWHSGKWQTKRVV